MDPFHVVQWMNDALDAVRCEEWNAARAARPRPEGKRGRPAKGELWIGNTYLDDSGRDSPASLNSTGDM